MEPGTGIRIESRPEYAKIRSTNYEILKFSLSYCMQKINSKENAKNDLQTVATQVGAERSYFETDWTKPTMLVLGSEASGLSEVELARIGESVSIPMESSVESLNLAVACGVIVFEARRQCLAA